MKAAVYHEYGLADVVHIEDVAKPVPKDDEVLIQVRAASVNPLDAGLMKGKPHTFRLFFSEWDVVHIEAVAKPVPKDDEVLIQVRAASVNPLDAGLMKGKPHTFRLFF